MIGRAAFTGVPLSAMPVLMLSIFTVSMGYGVDMLVTREVGKDADDMDADVSGRYVRKRVTEAIVSRVGTSPAQP